MTQIQTSAGPRGQVYRLRGRPCHDVGPPYLGVAVPPVSAVRWCGIGYAECCIRGGNGKRWGWSVLLADLYRTQTSAAPHFLVGTTETTPGALVYLVNIAIVLKGSKLWPILLLLVLGLEMILRTHLCGWPRGIGGYLLRFTFTFHAHR